MKMPPGGCGAWELPGSHPTPTLPYCPSAAEDLTPGTSSALRQNFKGSPALQGVTEGKVERSTKATQTSWMASCVAWQAGLICEGFWEGQCWLSHPERKNTPGKLQKQVCFNRGQTSYPSLWHMSPGLGGSCGAAPQMSRKVWPYREARAAWKHSQQKPQKK